MTGIEFVIALMTVAIILAIAIIIYELCADDYPGSESSFHVAHNWIFKMFLKIKAI